MSYNIELLELNNLSQVKYRIFGCVKMSYNIELLELNNLSQVKYRIFLL